MPTTPAQAPADVSSLRRELMELGGPNTLIWPARDPHVVDLTTAHPGGIAMLLSGRDARLSDLVREPGALLRAQRRAAELTEHVERIAQEHGVHTCFLAMGAASWHVPGEEERPLAPVVLRRAALRRLRPGSGRQGVCLRCRREPPHDPAPRPEPPPPPPPARRGRSRRRPRFRG